MTTAQRAFKIAYGAARAGRKDHGTRPQMQARIEKQIHRLMHDDELRFRIGWAARWVTNGWPNMNTRSVVSQVQLYHGGFGELVVPRRGALP